MQMRVVATTFLVSAIVVGAIGLFSVVGIRSGLITHKAEDASSVATATTAELQSVIASVTSEATFTDELRDAVYEIGARSQSPGGFYIRVAPASGTERSFEYPDTVRLADVGGEAGDPLPKKFFTAIEGEESTPALVVTDTLRGTVISGRGDYVVYYVFPMSKEVRTLNLVQTWVWATESALVLLLVLISWLVTRQVVTPVRMAARVAERLSAGRLHERMAVKGQDDLARLASSFNKMAVNLQQQIGQLEDLSRMQRRFVSDVSHELRTPLTTVRMAADLLHSEREAFEPDVARSAELMQRELDRFEALLVDLLEISRYDAGAAVLDAESVDIVPVLRRAVDQCERLASRRGTPLLVQIPGTMCAAEIESRRIERILRNLIVNAIEHAEGGPVEITLAADVDAVAISVRDYGVGMSPEAVEHVFERFWRADPARSRATGGTGLGLSISLEDAHLHGGWLQAWGEPGVGSNFRLTLPRHANGGFRQSPLPLRPVSIHSPLVEPADDMSSIPARAASLVRAAAARVTAPLTGDAPRSDDEEPPARASDDTASHAKRPAP